MEREVILRALQMINNNKTRAAGILVISQTTLHNKLQRYKQSTLNETRAGALAARAASLRPARCAGRLGRSDACFRISDAPRPPCGRRRSGERLLPRPVSGPPVPLLEHPKQPPEPPLDSLEVVVGELAPHSSAWPRTGFHLPANTSRFLRSSGS